MKHILIFTVLTFFACKSETASTSNMEDLDLMKYGLPIKIKAPSGSKVVSEDLGFVQDVTVKGEDNFYVQILGGSATTTNLADIKASQMKDVEKMPYFSKIVEQDDNGFIFEKEISEDHLNYDFRYIKVQGDKEYIFQTGLIGKFSVDDVKTMYSAVK